MKLAAQKPTVGRPKYCEPSGVVRTLFATPVGGRPSDGSSNVIFAQPFENVVPEIVDVFRLNA